MIEDALFLSLGFCTAVVLALAMLPLLWRRALRLTRQRLELLVPWSKNEIDAERDGLRAQAAVDQRRLEQQAEQSRAALAARTIELGRRTVELVQGEIARDALRDERAALVIDLSELDRELRGAEAQRFAAEKTLHDADRRIEVDAIEAGHQRLRYERLSTLAEERRGAIAALDTRVAGLVARVEDRDDALQGLTATLAAARAAHDVLSNRHETLVSAHAALEIDHVATQQALAQERRKAEERERRLQGRTEALAVAETRIAEQDTSMRYKDERFEILQRRFDALQADLAAYQDEAGRPDDPGARLRAAIVTAGDETLRLLALPPDEGEEATSPALTGRGR